MSDDYRAELAFAKQLAHDAKLISDKYYKQSVEFETKSDASPVTIADKQINQLVIDGVQKVFPADGVLGEEGSWQADKNRLWVCDPIDGTIAYMMGEAACFFSVALVIDGAPTVAVTRDLANGDLFWATKGGGAFRNGEPISVSSRTLEQAMVVFPTKFSSLYGHQKTYLDIAEAVYLTNVIHGGVFKGMLVAQGFVDAAPHLNPTQAWDAAAVKLIVDEAGGKATDIKGADHRYDGELTGGFIVTNGLIHDNLLRVITTSQRTA